MLLLAIFGFVSANENVKKLFGSTRILGEVNMSVIDRAQEVFRYPLDPNSHIIISMRWTKLEDQINHFVFGAALAYALNRSIIVEMRRYPLDKEQPSFLIDFKDIKPALYETSTFHRLRIARELFCKDRAELEPMTREVPILVRNFDDISSLYGNHFVGTRLREMFGMHAFFFLAHRYIKMDLTQEIPNSLAVDARSFPNVKRMKHLKDAGQIAKNFTNVIKKADHKGRLIIVTNDQKVTDKLQKKFTKAEFSGDSMDSLCKMVTSSKFIGTYRSKISTIVNMLRGEKSDVLNTDTGDIVDLSNSQAGVLSPYLQDVEDAEFTVNEKLRGCSDNIQDLREVLKTFVL